MIQVTTRSGGDRNSGWQVDQSREEVVSRIQHSREFYCVVYGPTIFDKESVFQHPPREQENDVKNFEMLKQIPASFGDLVDYNSKIVIAEVYNRFRDICGGGDLVVTLTAQHRDNEEERYAVQLGCQIKGAALTKVRDFLQRNPAALQQVMSIFDPRFQDGELIVSKNQTVLPQRLDVVENPETRRMEWKRGPLPSRY